MSYTIFKIKFRFKKFINLSNPYIHLNLNYGNKYLRNSFISKYWISYYRKYLFFRKIKFFKGNILIFKIFFVCI